MKEIYIGKTKDVYMLEDGNYLLKFKDDVTGTDGVFDPGANTVGLKMDGAGHHALKLTKYFFEILKRESIPTHYISADLNENTMTVKKATAFEAGLEFILRYKAVGSFIRRYGKYIRDGADLDEYVEVTLKDDQRNDPLITVDGLEALNILKKEEYEQCVALTKKIGRIVKDELAKHGLTLYDIKFEYGYVDGKIVLIDEISGGNMRVYRDDEKLMPIELTKLITG